MEWKKLISFAVGVALVVAISGQVAMAADPLERYMCFVVNTGAGPGGSTTLEVNITRWSSEEERDKLVRTLSVKGQEDMLDELTDMDETGWFHFQGRLAGRSAFPSTRLHYAHNFVQDGQRHIMLVTNRPISAKEAMQNTRSQDYDVTAILIQMPEGETKGKGIMYTGLKITTDEKTHGFKFENWGTSPLQLINIEKKK